MEKNSNGKKYVLIGIGFLIILLVGIGVFYFKNQFNSPKTVYTKLLDNFASSTEKMINESFDLIKKPSFSEYNINFNGSSNDRDLKNIFSIINQMKIKYTISSDYNNKNLNMLLNVKYNDNNLINGNTSIINNRFYLDIPELYDKALYYEDDAIDGLWNIADKEIYNTLIKELTKILKNNLKEEYFTNNSTGGINAYILDLNSKNLYTFKKNVLNDIYNNDILLDAIIRIDNITKEELKNSVKEYIDNLNEDKDEFLKITISINSSNKELEGLIIKNSEIELELQKDNNKFNIIAKENNENVNIGTLEMNDKLFEINIGYNNSKLKLSVKTENDNKKVDFELNANNVSLDYNISGNKENGEFTISFKEENVTSLTINGDYKINGLEKVELKEFSNSVKITDVTEDDYNKIMTNISNNETFMKLFQDIMLFGMDI